jgi:RecB family endonuclease NucS
MRLVIARCEVRYVGRLTAQLPPATRLLLVKADGSVSIHADDRAYKPLNWMSPPCTLREEPGRWTVTNSGGEQLLITIEEIAHDSTHELGIDPGLVKDGVEAHLQRLLAEHVATLGDSFTLVRREYPTAIGPVDLLCKDGLNVVIEEDGACDAPSARPVRPAAGVPLDSANGARPRHWAVEVKRRATLEAVDQLSRYLELLNRDLQLAPVGGILAAQAIAPQARTLAEDRGMRCVILDYDALRGIESTDLRLF